MARKKIAAQRDDEDDDFVDDENGDSTIPNESGLHPTEPLIVTATATIVGLTPMLMHRFSEQNEVQEQTREVHVANEDPRAQAERAAYRDDKGHLWFPAAAIARLLRESGSNHKQRGSRRSMKYLLPAAVLLTDDHMVLRNGDGRTQLKTFEVDSRPVVIPSTKGRIMRHRPKLLNWSTSFSLEIDKSLLDPPFIHQLLAEGGLRIGIGDFRPERGGPFGRFQVTSWKMLK